MNNSTISDILRILVSQTTYTHSQNSQENFLETDNTGGHYLSFGSGINVVCKQRAAHLFIGQTVPHMQTTNRTSRAGRKALTSDLHDTLDPVFQLADSGRYSQVLLEMYHHYRGEMDQADLALYISNMSVALSKLEETWKKIHQPLMQAS